MIMIKLPRLLLQGISLSVAPKSTAAEARGIPWKSLGISGYPFVEMEAYGRLNRKELPAKSISRRLKSSF